MDGQLEDVWKGYENFPPDIQLTIFLVLSARRWRAELDGQLRLIGQNSARMETLWAISRSPQDSTQTEIAHNIRVERATLTRMLDGLESEGYVKRLPQPADGRSKYIRVTEEGERALAKIMNIASPLRHALLEELGPDELDRATQFLVDLVNRIDDLGL
ncbi:MarR family winged helix-turn-helix transcriptional regulator [Altericroceibacterium spongiae]|nr:MarR family transcriptional regulator [Altericroceibacterium spongiae]